MICKTPINITQVKDMTNDDQDTASSSQSIEIARDSQGTRMTQKKQLTLEEQLKRSQEENEKLHRTLDTAKKNYGLLEAKHNRFKSRFNAEVENLKSIAGMILPASGTEPQLAGFDIYGRIDPMVKGMGGDLISYVSPHNYRLSEFIQKAIAERNKLLTLDRKRSAAHLQGIINNLERQQHIAGILVADVSGHQATDITVAGMFDASFHTAVEYELEHHGTITLELFEKLNDQVYRQRQCQQRFTEKSASKFISGIYGEIAEDGTFRFINAGHPMPKVFSYEQNKFAQIPESLYVRLQPFGFLPGDKEFYTDSKSILGTKKPYRVNQMSIMGRGDVLVLMTDGFEEHMMTRGGYEKHMERVLKKNKDGTAQEIGDAIFYDALNNHDWRQKDDMTLVIIKKTS